MALFRERRPEPPAIAMQAPAAPVAAERAPLVDLPLVAGPPPAAGARAKAFDADEQSLGRIAALPAPKLGTGHGSRETSVVTHTDFSRESPNPNELIRIRYDSFANLVAMGVIQGRPPMPPRPNAFPESPARYVPDPPGYSARGLR